MVGQPLTAAADPQNGGTSAPGSDVARAGSSTVTVFTASLVQLASTFSAPMYALPVDVFRILAGFVGLEYFRRAFVQTPDFSSPDGLIDHEMCRRLFPPTRLSLFQPGVPIGVLRAVFLLACVASILVIIGYQTKAAAAVLFVVAVSALRWNILVVYVDDAIVHLVTIDERKRRANAEVAILRNIFASSLGH